LPSSNAGSAQLLGHYDPAAPIVDLARLLALDAGDPAVATPARLQAAAEHGTAGTAATDLAAAFEYLQQLRLRHQTDRLAAGAVPDDAVPLAELTAFQRRWLKDTAELLRTCQESVRIAYRTDLIG
jgi:CBS domain-containing protein